MSFTTKMLIVIGVSTIAKIAILNAVGHSARKQLRETRPDLARYFDR